MSTTHEWKYLTCTCQSCRDQDRQEEAETDYQIERAEDLQTTEEETNE